MAIEQESQQPEQPEQQPEPARPALKRGRKSPNPRMIHFAGAGEMQPLPAALERVAELQPRPDIVLWCGNQPGRRLIREDLRAAAAAGWTYSNYKSALRSATLTRRSDDYRVEVRSSVPWFGAERDPDLVHDAWFALSRVLRSPVKTDDRGGFGESAYLWPTPTLTGQELLRGSLPFDREYPVLPDELLEILLLNFGGGRTEVLTAPGHLNAARPWLPALWNLDMRWSYASCLHGLPSGEPVWEKRGWHTLTLADVGYEPSFYHFEAHIPADWRHIGLLPRRERDVDGGPVQTFPHEPGRIFQGWATGAEIQVALTRGWRIESDMKLHWPYAGRHDPLKHWITRLRHLRGMAQREELLGGEPGRLAALVAGAIRNLVVHTVGSFNRTGRLDEGFTPYGRPDLIPRGALPLPGNGGWQWTREILHVDEWTHPEWFATVAGRVRAKAARKAMELPPEHLVAIRTDGIMTSVEPDVSGDTGTPGSWRVKWVLPIAVPAPRSTRAVLSLINQATDYAGDGLESDHREPPVDGAEEV